MVLHDWTTSLSANDSYMISPNAFTTPPPSNYDDVDLDDDDIARPPRPTSHQYAAVPVPPVSIHDSELNLHFNCFPFIRTKGALLFAKTQTAHFFRNLADLGPPPSSSSAEMNNYYAMLLELDKEFGTRLEQMLNMEPLEADSGMLTLHQSPREY